MPKNSPSKPRSTSKGNGRGTDSNQPASGKSSATSPPAELQIPNGVQRAMMTEEREIVYPVISVNGVQIPPSKLRITAARAKELLFWESEADTFNRLKEDNPKITRDSCSFGDSFLLKDEGDQKINCWNNCNNRPFTDSWARTLAQDILNKRWRPNLEDIIISKTGQVLSGQHRLVALILAVQMWQGKNKNHWQQIWQEEPYIESLVAFGADEDMETLSTYDNVKPRTLADIFYTSGTFSAMTLSNRDKREYGRVLEAAVDTLWQRTRQKGSYRDSYMHYQTHSASQQFLESHPKLLDCLKHIQECNSGKGRVLSKMKLSPGACTAALYLMGSCSSDRDAYYNCEGANEKLLSWDDWGTACQFFSDIVSDKAKMAPVKEAIKLLYDADDGSGGGRQIEKMVVLAKAWAAYKDGVGMSTEEVDEDSGQVNIMPEYMDDTDGVPQLVDSAVFGGIDNGDGKKRYEPLSEEEAEERKKKAQEERRQQLQKSIQQSAKKHGVKP